MIYGQRMYFTENTIDEIKKVSDNSKFNELLEGFNTVMVVAEATGNYDLLDTYSDLLEESYVESLTEGANLEYTKIFKQHFKQMREYSKKAKDNFKQKKFSEAKEYYQKALKETQDLEKDFKGVEDTVLSTILGIFIDFFVTFIPIFVGAIVVAIPASIITSPLTVGGVIVAGIGASSANPALAMGGEIATYVGASVISAVTSAYGIGVRIMRITQDIAELINIIKNWDAAKIEKNLNLYRNKLQTGIKLMASGYEKKIKQCDELIKAQKAASKK